MRRREAAWQTMREGDREGEREGCREERESS